jgi:hypothetical protein
MAFYSNLHISLKNIIQMYTWDDRYVNIWDRHTKVTIKGRGVQRGVPKGYPVLRYLWLRRGVFDTTWCDKVCQWLVAGRWFSPGTPVSSTNKKWPPQYNSNIVESGVKHHNPNPWISKRTRVCVFTRFHIDNQVVYKCFHFNTGKKICS